jgi:hypothetical protein
VGISLVTPSKFFIHKVFTDCCVLSAVGSAGKEPPRNHGASRLNSDAPAIGVSSTVKAGEADDAEQDEVELTHSHPP